MDMAQTLERARVHNLALNCVQLNEGVDRVTDLKVAFLHDSGIQPCVAAALSEPAMLTSVRASWCRRPPWTGRTIDTNICSHKMIMAETSDGTRAGHGTSTREQPCHALTDYS
jgi:hypothetical protein